MLEVTENKKAERSHHLENVKENARVQVESLKTHGQGALSIKHSSRKREFTLFYKIQSKEK